MRRTSGLAVLVALAGAVLIAGTGRAPASGPATAAGRVPQSGPPTPRFEVVSVKPTQPGTTRGGPGPYVQTEPGHLVARGTLAFFIEYA